MRISSWAHGVPDNTGSRLPWRRCLVAGRVLYLFRHHIKHLQPHSVLLGYVSGGRAGRPQAVDIEIQAREIIFHKNNLNNIMADYTGQPFEKVCRRLCRWGMAVSPAPWQPELPHTDVRPASTRVDELSRTITWSLHGLRGAAVVCMRAACKLIISLRQPWLTFRARRNGAAPHLRQCRCSRAHRQQLLSMRPSKQSLPALRALGPPGACRHVHAFVWSGGTGWERSPTRPCGQ